jgi:hypothetical protein
MLESLKISSKLIEIYTQVEITNEECVTKTSRGRRRWGLRLELALTPPQ